MISSSTRTAPHVRIRPARLIAAVCAGLLGMLPGPLTCGPASAEEPVREGAPPPAVTATGASPCGVDEICLFEENDYKGEPWRWTHRSGYRNVPPYLHDNTGSFIANVAGCFVDWGKTNEDREFRRVAIGDYSAAYKDDGKFGSRLDALQVYSECHQQ